MVRATQVLVGLPARLALVSWLELEEEVVEVVVVMAGQAGVFEYVPGDGHVEGQQT